MAIRLFRFCPHCGHRFEDIEEMVSDGVCVICDFDRKYPKGEENLREQIADITNSYKAAKDKKEMLLNKIIDGGMQ